MIIREKHLTKEALDALGLNAATLGGLTREQISVEITAAILGAAPDALNTLQELADALGDDPNFAATTASLIGAAQTAANAAQAAADAAQADADAAGTAAAAAQATANAAETPGGAQAKVDALELVSPRGPVFRTAKPVRVVQAAMPAVDTVLYTVPSGKVAIIHAAMARNISGAAATFSANLVPSGGAAAADNLIVAVANVVAGASAVFNCVALLVAGEALSGRASAAGALHVGVRVTEVDAAEASALGLARGHVAAPGGGGDVVVYTCPVGKRAFPLLLGFNGTSFGTFVSRTGAAATTLQKFKAGSDPSLPMMSTAVSTGQTLAELTVLHLNAGDSWVAECTSAGQTVNVFSMWQEVDA